MIETSRRGFIAGALALLAAPAVVRAERLMPVRRLFVPQRFIPCDGRIVRRADYPDLFAVIGGLYGTAGVAAFRVPDMRGNFLREFSVPAAQSRPVLLSFAAMINSGLDGSPPGAVSFMVERVPE